MIKMRKEKLCKALNVDFLITHLRIKCKHIFCYLFPFVMCKKDLLHLFGFCLRTSGSWEHTKIPDAETVSVLDSKMRNLSFQYLNFRSFFNVCTANKVLTKMLRRRQPETLPNAFTRNNEILWFFFSPGSNPN